MLDLINDRCLVRFDSQYCTRIYACYEIDKHSYNQHNDIRVITSFTLKADIQIIITADKQYEELCGILNAKFPSFDVWKLSGSDLFLLGNSNRYYYRFYGLSVWFGEIYHRIFAIESPVNRNTARVSLCKYRSIILSRSAGVYSYHHLKIQWR